MRVVLDTNVLMSGIFFAGPPARILAAWAEGELELLVTVDILAEYRRVVEQVPIPAYACSDEDDLKFLACASAGNAACVVSRDRALLRASGYEGIEVMTPREFQTRFLDE